MKPEEIRLTKIQEIGTNLIVFLIIALIFLMFFRYLFLVVNYPSSSSICRKVYGEEYEYVRFKHFGNQCVILNLKNISYDDSQEYPFKSHKEIRELCAIPKFWNLLNWSSGVCD
jgi:hypothetical protein